MDPAGRPGVACGFRLTNQNTILDVKILPQPRREVETLSESPSRLRQRVVRLFRMYAPKVRAYPYRFVQNRVCSIKNDNCGWP